MTTGYKEAPRPRSVAPLKNVAATVTLINTLVGRPAGLPGIGVIAGPSGYGKTMAAAYAQNVFGAVYIECRSFWTQKIFCEMLLRELGVDRPRGRIADLMEEITSLLGRDPDRPLIIDEADKLVDRHAIELVRDIHETTRSPIVLVGEELLPQKLGEHERVHNRVLDWVLAQPCDSEDTRALAAYLCRGVKIADDLLEHIRAQTGGRARRIATTLYEVEAFARNVGSTELDLASYGGRIFSGETPRRHQRVA